MKDAKKYILDPAKKATKKKVKTNLKPVKKLGITTGTGTTCRKSTDSGNMVRKRWENIINR